MADKEKNIPFAAIRKLMILIILMLSFSAAAASGNSYPITISYSGVMDELQTISVEFKDEWLLLPETEYNHDLMHASFVMAAAGFRNELRDLTEKDHDILDFFEQAGFVDPQTDDYDVPTEITTIGSAIAHKKIGDDTLIAVSISGNNYQREWLSNLTIGDETRPHGFNQAARKVLNRVRGYIKTYELSGNLRLWVAGYSRSAAVSNIFAADAVDSGLFQAVYAYTFATPRTTKDSDPGKYKNIFNMINPFDFVPMVPFPEWGFNRYGTDLYLPAVETDSRYFEKFYNAYEFSVANENYELVYNPGMNKDIHMLLDYLSFFISSSAFYKEKYQNALVDFYSQRDVKQLVKDFMEQFNLHGIREIIRQASIIRHYRFHEIWNFLDYLSQFIYSSFRAQKHFSNESYWDPSISIQENLAFNHYDATYRAWLFSDIAPEDLYVTEPPKYSHFTVTGNVDIAVLNEKGDFTAGMSNDGSTDIPEDLVEQYGSGGYSDQIIYLERKGQTTSIILPEDQVFTVVIKSNEKQTIKASYIEFSADKVRASVRYVYEDEYDKGETYPEVIDPQKERNYTAAELEAMGVMVIEPWEKDIVYSPTGIMLLEYSGVFHPSPMILITFTGLILIFILYILVLLLVTVLNFGKQMLGRRRARK